LADATETKFQSSPLPEQLKDFMSEQRNEGDKEGNHTCDFKPDHLDLRAEQNELFHSMREEP
jgi:hypothetical protein